MIIKTKTFRLFIRLLIFIGFLATAAPSCEERFDPEIDEKYENLLVIDGMITNMSPPYTIKLSTSSFISNPKYTPYQGCNVEVSDNLGNTETFSESSKGTYTSSPNGLHGIAGRKYQITIHTPAGKTYQSEFLELRQAVGIDSLFAVVEEREDENLPYTIEGYQFYVNTKIPENDSSYFFWDLTATYQYESDFIIRWMYDGTLHAFTNSDSLKTCWKTNRIPQIFTFSTAGLSSPRVENFPLHYVTTAQRDISIRYSLLASQFTISEEAYVFWKEVRAQNSELDELYTKQPFQIRGNVFNPEDANEPVLGYFLVAGEVQKRIFVDRPEPPIKMRYPVCVLVEADYMNFGALFLTTPAEWPQYATFDNNGISAWPNQECLDCRLRDGTVEKPEFWTDL